MMYQLGASSTAIYPFDGSSPTWTFWASSIIILIAGTLFVMWLGERITEKGVGNGISLLIMIGIIARLPFALFGEFVSRLTDAGGGLVMFLIEIVALLAVILLVILLLLEMLQQLVCRDAHLWINGIDITMHCPSASGGMTNSSTTWRSVMRMMSPGFTACSFISTE